MLSVFSYHDEGWDCIVTFVWGWLLYWGGWHTYVKWMGSNVSLFGTQWRMEKKLLEMFTNMFLLLFVIEEGWDYPGNSSFWSAHTQIKQTLVECHNLLKNFGELICASYRRRRAVCNYLGVHTMKWTRVDTDWSRLETSLNTHNPGWQG